MADLFLPVGMVSVCLFVAGSFVASDFSDMEAFQGDFKTGRVAARAVSFMGNFCGISEFFHFSAE